MINKKNTNAQQRFAKIGVLVLTLHIVLYFCVSDLMKFWANLSPTSASHETLAVIQPKKIAKNFRNSKICIYFVITLKI